MLNTLSNQSNQAQGLVGGSQYAAELAAKQRAMSEGPVPHQTIQDIHGETLGGLYELRNALESLADRVSGSTPKCDEGGKIASQPCLMDQAQSIRTLVSACHQELARIQRVL